MTQRFERAAPSRRVICPALLTSVASSTAEIVDPTAPVSAATPTAELSPAFGNLIDFSAGDRFGRHAAGQAWKHANIQTGERILTRAAAKSRWITVRDGEASSQISVMYSLRPGVVVDFGHQAEQRDLVSLEVALIELRETAHDALPDKLDIFDSVRADGVVGHARAALNGGGAAGNGPPRRYNVLRRTHLSNALHRPYARLLFGSLLRSTRTGGSVLQVIRNTSRSTQPKTRGAQCTSYYRA